MRKWFTSSAMQHIKLGKYNQLEVVKTVDFGVYLDGFDDGEILLPTRYVPADCRVGDVLNVFIYLDNEERLVATTLEPLVQVGQFAWLEVSWVNEYGAFLNWGLMKDLFVPFRVEEEGRVDLIARTDDLPLVPLAKVRTSATGDSAPNASKRASNRFSPMPAWHVWTWTRPAPDKPTSASSVTFRLIRRTSSSALRWSPKVWTSNM